MSNPLPANTIRTEIATGTHSRIYRETLTVGQHMCEIEIESSFYQFQCLAQARVWDPTQLQWHSVADIHFSLMKTEAKLFFHAAVTQDEFATDRHKLLGRLVEILSHS